MISEGKITSFWFPMITRGFMSQYGDTRFALFKKAMEVAFLERNLDSEASVGLVFNELALSNPSIEQTIEASTYAYKWYSLMEHESPCTTIQDSDDLNSLLMLKEFDAGAPEVTSMYELKNRKIVSVSGANYSADFSTFNNLNTYSYSAQQYPVSVPVFYLQGTFDGATPAPGASLHYKKAAKKSAQILFFKGSSHMPLGPIVQNIDRASEKWQSLQDVFSKFLDGTSITCDDKQRLEAEYPFVSLAIASKGFSQNIFCR